MTWLELVKRRIHAAARRAADIVQDLGELREFIGTRHRWKGVTLALGALVTVGFLIYFLR